MTFISINIFQGNNFAKQYHALNTVSRLFHSYAKISNIFYKIKGTLMQIWKSPFMFLFI